MKRRHEISVSFIGETPRYVGAWPYSLIRTAFARHACRHFLRRSAHSFITMMAFDRQAKL